MLKAKYIMAIYNQLKGVLYCISKQAIEMYVDRDKRDFCWQYVYVIKLVLIMCT